MKFLHSLLPALTLLALTLVLTACSSSRGGTRQAWEGADPSLLYLCPTPLPAPRSGSLEHVLQSMKDRTELYYTCATRHESLAQACTPTEPHAPAWWRFWEIYW